MSNLVYSAYKTNALKGGIAFLTDSIKVALLKSTYVPDQDAHAFWSDVSAQETSGTNYTPGGQLLTSKTATQDSTNHRGVAGAANPSWANVTFTDARYAAVYKDTGNASTSPLITLIDLGPQVSNADAFTIQLNASGLYYLG